MYFRKRANIVFCWVMHEQCIIDTIISRLNTNICRIISISLLCSRQALAQRLESDIVRGMRSADIIERSAARIPLFQKLDTVKIDTTDRSVEDVANEISRL